MKHVMPLLLALPLLGAAQAHAFGLSPVVAKDEAILVIGASLEDGGSPCELNTDGTGVENNPLFCGGLNFGVYQSLATALQNRFLVQGQVINEAIGGATTFARGGYPTRLPDGTVPGEAFRTPVGWEQYGFNQQYVRAFTQVFNPLVTPPAVNARYIVIGIPNDCLHANAFDVAPASTDPDECSKINPGTGKTGLEEMVDRLIALGQTAIDSGITPIYTGYPPYVTGARTDGINLAVSQALFGFSWVISETEYNSMIADYATRIPATLGADNVIMADVWSQYENFGDGLHPDFNTSRNAAIRIVLKIKQFEN
ncbi:MAG: hypothetical protein AAF560_24725 [Acidobacteriota bacterium]